MNTQTPNNTPKNESDKIFDTIENEWGQIIKQNDRHEPGPYIDGYQGLKWMKKNNCPGWKQNEWPAFLIRGLITHLLPDLFQKKVTGNYKYLKGNYYWDIRVHSVTTSNQWIILTDCNNSDKLIKFENGYGLIVVNIIANLEINHEFREFHEELKGGSSEYTRNKENNGAPKRRRKTGFFVKDISAFYFPTLDDFKKGLNEGWLGYFKQGINSNDNDRNIKYKFNPTIENSYKIGYRLINADLEDFEEEYNSQF